MRISGYCPMGCGETLRAYFPREFDLHTVRCSAGGCPDPRAVDTILSDPEHEHVVTLSDTSFSVKHPLRERVSDELLSCALGSWLGSLDGPPHPPGVYRVTAHADGGAIGKAAWTFELQP